MYFRNHGYLAFESLLLLPRPKSGRGSIQRPANHIQGYMFVESDEFSCGIHQNKKNSPYRDKPLLDKCQCNQAWPSHLLSHHAKPHPTKNRVQGGGKTHPWYH